MAFSNPSQDETFVSFLIPARNAATSISATLGIVHAYLTRRMGSNFEIIVIPNPASPGSDDGTERESRAVAARLKEVRVIPNYDGLGKGSALQSGFRVSRGNWIWFTDADLPYDLGFFDRASDLMKQGADFITGNRRARESVFCLPNHLLHAAYTRHRLGLFYNSFVRKFFPVKTQDTQAGIKAMSREFAEAAFARMTCTGFMFDLELFLVAEESGFEHVELPVILELRSEKSTVQVFKETVRAVYWLTKIRNQFRRGHYRLGADISPIARFRRVPWGTRVFLSLRWRLTPYEYMSGYLPKSGKILDLGCGHGLFALTAAMRSRGREVVGIDHDPARVALAHGAAAGAVNLSLKAGRLQDALSGSSGESAWSGISMIDVLHYLSPGEQEALVRSAWDRLAPGGVLLVREVEPDSGIASWINRLYEKVATSSGFTRSERDSNAFRSRAGWRDLFRSTGFQVTDERCGSRIFSDVLFVCTKAESPVLQASFPKITADDWGISPGVNRGILKLAQQGVVRRVSVLSEAEFASEGLNELSAIPGIEIGLHFNLTYESRFTRPSQVLFYWLNPLKSGRSKSEWVRSEFRRQMDQLESLGVRAAYVDGHHHIHLVPGILEALAGDVKSRGITRVRLPWDLKLWKSRWPLLALCVLARPAFRRHGFHHDTCFYPGPEAFADPARLRALLSEHRNSEIIVHPSAEDDLAQVGSSDPYRSGRVMEFQALSQLHPAP